MIRAVLFDMDGTLIDSEHYYCDGTYEYMKKMGYTGDLQQLYDIIGTTMEDTYEILSSFIDGRYSPKEIEDVHIRYFTENPLDHKEYIFKEVPEVLAWLKKKGYKLGICSGSAFEEIEKFISNCQLQDFFDVVLSTDAMEPKPKPDVYLEAMAILGVRPEETVVVEDSPNGLKAAKASSAFVMGRIAEHLSGRQEADMMIRDLYELKTYLGGQG